MKISNPKLTSNAQTLRKNMTKEERRLWYDFLKTLPVTINRQKVIGGYIVDFYCAAARLVIELDGSQHYEVDGIIADTARDEYLQSLGLTILRYSNREVNQQFCRVCEDILNHLSECSPHQSASLTASPPKGKPLGRTSITERNYTYEQSNHPGAGHHRQPGPRL